VKCVESERHLCQVCADVVCSNIEMCRFTFVTSEIDDDNDGDSVLHGPIK